MDGLTISNSNALVNSGSTLGEIRDSKINSGSHNIAQPAGNEGQKTFADTLKDAVQNVNQMQKESDQKIQELSVGKAKSIEDVMITAEKADISLKLMVSVRNKIIEAYQDIMKMQV